jgi:DNA-binding NtrC family response regulator
LHFFFFASVRMARSFLIVDADRNFREALAIALRLDGYRALACGCTEDALAKIQEGGIGCCVVDAHLAGADALLATAVRSGLRTVMTGPYPDLLAHAARRHPQAELLPKPFRTAELTEGRGSHG